MARRVLTPDIFEDEWFGNLGDREQLVWVGLFGVLADDQGRLLDSAPRIRSRLWPYRDVPVSDVAAAVERFVADGRLHRYEAEGKSLLQVVSWWRHQRPRFTSPSAFPAPPGWTDRIKTRINGEYVEHEWETAGGFARSPRTNPSHEPLVLAHEPVPEPVPVERSNPSSNGRDRKRPLREEIVNLEVIEGEVARP